ncbi:type VI secretion system ImpA family N-terminal domain-containing protein [Leclercia adecarboxylata]|uniref:VasL domain-containing protein n=1 Tax=Leclercia adecarboxylata TaxID=83655 RepID=UPI00202A784C|nr:VasL domain-containing protein [Leclercia adecarboxylata]URN97475.1 type VI secretion system ImpA family N-terminal domain-containing protein [Leclercia adecarboxylata]
MTTLSERPLKTGGDPRTLADYVALRNEMNKLTHPARPDVNWQHVEKRCLSLFEHNGVDLQTAAWFSLARVHLSGVSGLNQGLAIVTALVTREWDNLWPQSVQARMEILNTLIQRLQRVLRSQSLTSADHSQLLQAEGHLNLLDDILQRLDVMRVSQLDALRAQIHSAGIRSGQTDGLDSKLPEHVAVPAETLSEPTEHIKSEPVVQPESRPTRMTEPPPPAKPWKPFAAGMVAMLVLGGILAGGWRVMQQPEPVQKPLTPLPTALTGEQLHQSPHSAENGIIETQQQLARLMALKPDWSLSYGDYLVEEALRLWPEQGKSLAQKWQQQKVSVALAPENLTGWYEGVTQLEQLAARLNALDEQKGKYMTVSELKSAVFAVLQSLNRTVPAEEQLRQLSVIPSGQASTAIRQNQLEQHLQQLIASYAVLKNTPAE